MNLSDQLTATVHNFEDMLSGKTDFNGFLAGEGAMIEADIAQANAAVQPFLQIAYEGLKAGASVLVGAGETALGQIINASSDDQATTVLNMMSAAGIPTGGPLSIAEHAALKTLIDGAKTQLDRLHLKYATLPAAPADAAQQAVAAKAS